MIGRAKTAAGASNWLAGAVDDVALFQPGLSDAQVARLFDDQRA